MANISSIKKHVVQMLGAGLSPALTYHCIKHTLAVTMQCAAIAKAEGVHDKDEIAALQIAALYHDTGFITTYKNHEKKSCGFAKRDLRFWGFKEPVIEHICELIMATKIPQSPKNKLQQIICDADLDYLGTKNFFTISKDLFEEVKAYKIVSSKAEWEKKQLRFLATHHYFTASSQKKRAPLKLQHLKKLTKAKVAKQGI